MLQKASLYIFESHKIIRPLIVVESRLVITVIKRNSNNSALQLINLSLIALFCRNGKENLFDFFSV